MKYPSNLFVDVVLIGAMSLAALGGLAYGWWHWRVGFAKETLPFWRRTIATIGLLLVTLHALLVTLLWTLLGAATCGLSTKHTV